MTLSLIPRPTVLFALTLILGFSSFAIAGDPDDVGSFDDILVALEPDPSVQDLSHTPSLQGPVINGPTDFDLTAPQAQSNGLILEGPMTTPGSYSTQPNETQMRSVMVPGQNPFLDFETVVEAPAPKQVIESQYVLPSLEAPTITAPRHTLPRIEAPVPNREFTIPQNTMEPMQPRVVTKTIVVEAFKPQCPYERALRLRRLALEEMIARSGPGYRTGYVPYGGLGLDRNDDHRPAIYRSRTITRYVPVQLETYSPSCRYTARMPVYVGGR